MLRLKWGLFVLVVLGMQAGCQTVKPYQRAYLNDPEMQLGLKAGQRFESYVESIREGATPPGGAKASGGCGCN
jgi:hypothetical protein